LFNLLHEEAEEVPVRPMAEVSPDPGDDPICWCAQEGNADFIVTLNPRDFPQRKLKAKIVSPAEFLRPLRRGSE
jgi:predicted nucleic acid-binding protein